MDFHDARVCRLAKIVVRSAGSAENENVEPSGPEIAARGAQSWAVGCSNGMLPSATCRGTKSMSRLLSSRPAVFHGHSGSAAGWRRLSDGYCRAGVRIGNRDGLLYYSPQIAHQFALYHGAFLNYHDGADN